MMQTQKWLVYSVSICILVWFVSPAKGDRYDETVLEDKPWAYWRLKPVQDDNVSIVPDMSHQSTLRFGRFVGLLVDSGGCDEPPCVWASNNTNQSYTSFNSRGKVVIPGFFLPPLTEFTIELWFSPACNTTHSSDRQTLLRLENESTAFTPRLGLGHGEVLTGMAALNSPASNSTYYASLTRIAAPQKLLSAGLWYHAVLALNGTALLLYVDGVLASTVAFRREKQLGSPCVEEREGVRCVRGQGLVLGEGFNGRIQRVAVYDYGLSPSRIASHTKALSTHTGQVVVNPEAEGSLFEAEGSLSEAEGSLFFSGGNRPYASSESGVSDSTEDNVRGEWGATRVWTWLRWRGGGAGITNKTGHFFECAVDTADMNHEPGKYCESGVVTVSTLVSFLCLVLAAFIRLRWTEQAHLTTVRLDRHQRSAQRLLAIPELLPVQHDPPMYPTVTLMVLSVLLAMAYASNWYVSPGLLSIEGRTVYPLQYVSWGVIELWGALLLLSLAELRLPQGTGAAIIIVVSAGTTLGAFVVDLLGGEGLCEPDSAHKTWLDAVETMSTSAAYDDGWPRCKHGYGFPLIGLGLLSLVPAWVLSAPKAALPSVISAGSRKKSGGGANDLEASLLSEASAIAEGLLGRKHQDKTLACVRYWYFFSCFCRRSLWTLLIAIPSTGIQACWRASALIAFDCGSLLLFAAILFRSSAADWPILTNLYARHPASPSNSTADSDASGLLSPLDMGEHEEEEGEEEEERGREEEEEEEGRLRSEGEGGGGGEVEPDSGGGGGGAQGGGRGRGAGGRGRGGVDEFSEIQPDLDAIVSQNPPQAEGSDPRGGSGPDPSRRTAAQQQQQAPHSQNQRSEAVLLKELRGMGYVVWKDAFRGGTQAVLGADFSLARQTGVLVVCLSLLAIGTLLWLAISPSMISVGCWATAIDLQALRLLSPDASKVKITCPQDGCQARQNLMQADVSRPIHGPSVLWGWNDVFGGGEGSQGVYADRSALCRMAQHAGAVKRTDSVCFSLSLAPGRAQYNGSHSNGVQSLDLDLTLDPKGHAAFSILPSRSPTLCPFDLKWYLAACLVPLTAGLVAANPTPFLLWAALASITFFLHVLLSINASDKDVIPTHSAGISWQPYQLLAALLYLFLFIPAMYLLGPCWVLRATPWTSLLPTPSSQHRFAHRLPSPAKHPRGLMSRNFLCFCLPMLLSGLLQHFIPPSFFRDLVPSPTPTDWGDSEGGGGRWSREVWVNGQRALLAMAIVLSCFLAVYNLRLCYRLRELWRGILVCALVALSLFLTTIIIHDRYQLRLRQYMLWAAFIPFTTHDNHVSAACQGVLLGLAVRGLVVNGAQPLWTEVEPIQF